MSRSTLVSLTTPPPFQLPNPLPLDGPSFLPLTAGLSREVAGWCEESARLIPVAEGAWDNEGAVLVGLLVRVTKMLRRMARALEEGDGEAVEIFGRCVFESVVNARALLTPGNEMGDRTRGFIQAGFETEELIRKDLEKREEIGPPPDEQEVLDGLRGWMTVQGIPTRIEGLGNLKGRLERAALGGKGEIYFWVMPSQAVHGSWVNLQSYHLEKAEPNGWVPPFESCQSSPVLPMAMVEHAWALVQDYLALKAPSEWESGAAQLKVVSARLNLSHRSLADALGTAG